MYINQKPETFVARHQFVVFNPGQLESFVNRFVSLSCAARTAVHFGDGYVVTHAPSKSVFEYEDCVRIVELADADVVEAA